ncbi:uncharacterized protein IUM83_02811 [Phytophthora cinnamomi]|uniref:uncharacterized protein n=1 Tax=Phytophthora cinnamomi TaxID=4785 RepID=UPI00355A6495|nr:hypothetical protein IUM83_02811 [Phytophthora cinnamomi]
MSRTEKVADTEVEDEERGLAHFTKLKAFSKQVPVDKYQTLLRRNPDPNKVKALVKSDPQLNTLGTAVGNSRLRITARDVKRLNTIAAKDPTGVSGSKVFMLIFMLCVITGVSGFMTYSLLRGINI